MTNDDLPDYLFEALNRPDEYIDHGHLLARLFQARCIANPTYAKDVLFRTQSYEGHNLTSALQVQDEMFMLMFTLCDSTLGGKNWTFIGMNDTTQELAAYMFHLLTDATPYLWRREMREASLHSGGLPPHGITGANWANSPMWWSWDQDMYYEDDGPNGEWVNIGWLVWKEADYLLMGIVDTRQWFGIPQKEITRLNQDGEPLFKVLMGAFSREGMTYPHDLPAVNLERYGEIAKMVGFLNSVYVDPREEFPNRAVRRQQARAGWVQKPVTVVKLRHRFIQREATDESGVKREYDWRWMVSGHWRNQWHGPNQPRQLTWIAPYVKGPEDKPLKATLYDVVR